MTKLACVKTLELEMRVGISMDLHSTTHKHTSLHNRLLLYSSIIQSIAALSSPRARYQSSSSAWCSCGFGAGLCNLFPLEA